MSEGTGLKSDQTPEPTKHSDAERVSSDGDEPAPGSGSVPPNPGQKAPARDPQESENAS